MASAIGPLLAALLFYLQGNSWSLNTLGIVVLIGMAISVIPIGTVFMFNDDYSLETETSPVTEALLPQKDAGSHCAFDSPPKTSISHIGSVHVWGEDGGGESEPGAHFSYAWLCQQVGCVMCRGGSRGWGK